LDALQKKYQVPFQVCESSSSSKEGGGPEKPFLMCRYNRVGENNQHRSPWTRQLYPKDDSNNVSSSSTNSPSDDIEMLEATTNEVWDSYKNLYYGRDAVGSVYLRATDRDGSFQGLFGVYKKIINENAGSSFWHSVSLVHVDEPGAAETCKYRVETTVLVMVESGDNDDGGMKLDLSAMLSKETVKECKVSLVILAASHIENLGEIIEANEMDLRSQLERVHLPKTIETVDTMLKKKEVSFKPAVNPLMAMMMDSSVLKKKIAQQAAEE
jgi:hypothetical protein